MTQMLLCRSNSVSPYTNWLSKMSETDVVMAVLGSGAVVTVDMGGHARLWETGYESLQRSLTEWKNMIGTESPVQVSSELCLGNKINKIICLTRQSKILLFILSQSTLVKIV